MKRLLMVISVLILASCGGRRAADAPATRSFPDVKVPSAVSEDERMGYALSHFWDGLIKDSDGFATDSLMVAGVSMDDMEKAAGTYASLVRIVSPEESSAALAGLEGKLDDKGDTALFKGVASLIEKYLYDTQSPVRNEDAFGAFCAAAAVSPLLTDSEKELYAKWASLAALAAAGTVAPDFEFIDLAGRRRTLHGLRADWTVLIFGNPDCEACRTLVGVIEESEDLSLGVSAGDVAVLDIYVDEDLEAWRASAKDFPKAWTVGYDPLGIIRSDTVYHLRAIPSIYLLDKEKKVVLKDAPEEVLIEYLYMVI